MYCKFKLERITENPRNVKVSRHINYHGAIIATSLMPTGKRSQALRHRNTFKLNY